MKLLDAIRSAIAGRWRPWEVRDRIRSAFAGLWGPQPTGPTVPYKIASDPNHVPTGLNLVQNGSFETGPFWAGTEKVFSGSGVIDNWLVIPNGGEARWIDASHAIFRNAAEGARFVDLTGGHEPGPSRVLAKLFHDASLGLQAGQSYEVALDLGVGPNNGPGANFGPPVSASVRVFRPPEGLDEQFVSNPVNPPQGSGVTWEHFSFRFKIPAGFTLKDQTILITGEFGYCFIGVDNVSVRLLT